LLDRKPTAASLFVILCEGDSEQIILPRIASALGLDIDPSFVAIVPLGGRHVNHFWRLLTELKIPYATLLDLDLGRAGSGWGRIKYICEQLITIDVKKSELLAVTDKDGKKSILSDEDFSTMEEWTDLAVLKQWIDFLENYGMFFSFPLDLDMAMLFKFPDVYRGLADRGPYSDVETASKAVLKEAGAGLSAYTGNLAKYRDLFPWYNYLFLGQSKPSTHLLALSKIENNELAKKAPTEIKRLLKFADSKIKLAE